MRFLRSKNPSLLSDEELIKEFRMNGNTSIIGVLFERYSHLVYGVSYNYLKDEEDCKDAVLQIFENLGRDLIRYEIKNFSSWLHVVTKNYSLRQLSKRRETTPLSNQAELSVEEEEVEPEFKIHLPNLSVAIEQLNAEQKQCIELFYIRELSYKEITDQTGFNLNQVKSYIQNGKRNLKLILLNKK